MTLKQYSDILEWLYTRDGEYANRNDWRRDLLLQLRNAMEDEKPFDPDLGQVGDTQDTEKEQTNKLNVSYGTISTVPNPFDVLFGSPLIEEDAKDLPAVRPAEVNDSTNTESA